MGTSTNQTMIVFTDRSAHANPSPTGSGMIIKNKVEIVPPIKIAKAVKCMGPSYKAELEAIQIATEHGRDNISTSNDIFHIFSVCQSSILAIMSQNRENYHNSTARAIQENFMDIGPKVQNIRIVYCPAHQIIEENELADSFSKTTSKKVKYPQSNTQLSPSEIQQGNKMLSISKWTRKWENSKDTKYKNTVSRISHKKLTLRVILSKNTSRKGISKITRLKTGHSMLKGHKSKIDTETSTVCSTYKKKETPEDFLLTAKNMTQNQQN